MTFQPAAGRLGPGSAVFEGRRGARVVSGGRKDEFITEGIPRGL